MCCQVIQPEAVFKWILWDFSEIALKFHFPGSNPYILENSKLNISTTKKDFLIP